MKIAKVKRKALMFALMILFLSACAPNAPDGVSGTHGNVEDMEKELISSGIPIREEALLLKNRFGVPAGYERIPVSEGSFAFYLRNLPLKPNGTEVRTFDGRIKRNREAYAAVVDMDIGDRDLQQCADAVMRLRAEHLLGEGLFEEISFNLTNGFSVPYSKWRDGWRVRVEGNETVWEKRTGTDDTYGTFRKYLEFIFAYAGTLSLERDMKPVSFENMEIGDVLVQGGSPGHAVIVADMAENTETGERLFMLAQSYMPAQDIHILRNPGNVLLSPWYLLDDQETVRTPEWTFRRKDLKRFQ